MSEEYVTTREQDEHGYWYTRTVGPGNFLSIQMDQADVKKMMEYQKEHPPVVPENLSMFAKMYEKLGNAKLYREGAKGPNGPEQSFGPHTGPMPTGMTGPYDTNS